MVLHRDEATPHLHIDFVPVATEQTRGLSTRVSMKQALNQQGFIGQSQKQTEWAMWMDREKEVLCMTAQEHSFEVIRRRHMDIPEFKEAVRLPEQMSSGVKGTEKGVKRCYTAEPISHKKIYFLHKIFKKV